MFAAELPIEDVEGLLDEFITSAAQSGLQPLVRLAATIRKHRDGILAGVRLGVSNE